MAHKLLGSTRIGIGLGSWLAPDRAMEVFGIDPRRSDRFVARLFGSRDIALGATLLVAPAAARGRLAALGLIIDTVDAVAGLDERRRGNLSLHATLLGPGGAVLLAALGLFIAREASATPA